MERQYQSLEKQLRAIPPQAFTHLFHRFGFPEYHITIIWQSEIVQMAYRNYLSGFIDLDYFYLIVYEWVENNRFEYGRKSYKLFIYGSVRREDLRHEHEQKVPRTAFLYSKMNRV